jgi:integrase
VSNPLPVPAATRTPPKRKARQLAKHLRGEHPDYAYLKAVFRHLRDELDVEVQREPKRLPYVPTEAEVRRYYEVAWTGRRGQDIVLIKTLLFTGVRASELVRIRVDDVDLMPAASASPRARGPRTAPCPSRARSRRPWPSTSTPNGPRRPPSCFTFTMGPGHRSQSCPAGLCRQRYFHGEGAGGARLRR